MNKKEVAQMLDGRQYGDELDGGIAKIASDNHLVVVFGYSDDNCEFDGAISEEVPCWEGQKIYFNKDGSNFTNENGEALFTYYHDKHSPEVNMVEAVWCDRTAIHETTGKYFAWTYRTEIPHETFVILEGKDPFCRGIVFSVSDLA